MATFFISDMHFGHFNILRYEPCRLTAMADFIAGGKFTAEDSLVYLKELMSSGVMDDREELLRIHDEMIIRKWNKVVKPSDTVWVLGDISRYNRVKTAELINRLNGTKNLILGNHDNLSMNKYYEMGFRFVSKYPIIFNNTLLLSHKPMPNPAFHNIYGHIHLHNSLNTPTIDTDGNICVCVERHDFKPIQIPYFN